MGKTEVTQAQWQKVMGTNPTEWQKLMGTNPAGFQDCPTCPVDDVGWAEAHYFVAKLDSGGKQGLRLPTEAQWEYACRSGGKEETYCGGSDLDQFAWYDENSGSMVHPVAGKAPNGLGLYDMSGNAWEWTCSIKASPHDGAEVRCGSKEDTNTPGTRRGGSWVNDPRIARAAIRNDYSPGLNYGSVGFRLARTTTP